MKSRTRVSVYVDLLSPVSSMERLQEIVNRVIHTKIYSIHSVDNSWKYVMEERGERVKNMLRISWTIIYNAMKCIDEYDMYPIPHLLKYCV